MEARTQDRSTPSDRRSPLPTVAMKGFNFSKCDLGHHLCFGIVLGLADDVLGAPAVLRFVARLPSPSNQHVHVLSHHPPQAEALQIVT